MKEKIINCPKCKVVMRKLTNGKFIIDECTECLGIFLDADERGRIHNQGFLAYVRAYWRR